MNRHNQFVFDSLKKNEMGHSHVINIIMTMIINIVMNMIMIKIMNEHDHEHEYEKKNIKVKNLGFDI